jgi:hypothetical protein
MPIDPKLIEYAATDRQREVLESLLETGSKRETARQLGLQPQHVRRVLRGAETEAAKRGYSPQHNITHPLPEHLMLTGTSTLVDHATGDIRMQWYKSGVDRHQMREMVVAAANAIASTLPKEKPIAAPNLVLDDFLSCYVVTDFHMGALAWGVETGDDWDTQIAEETIYNWAVQAMQLTPKSRRAVFAQLGDFLHYDSLESITPTAKNILESDSRFPKIVEATVRALRRVIRLMLSHHEEVIVLMAEGNHDIASSVWLRELFTVLYEDEPRVTVDKSPLPYYAVEHGKTSVFFSHGHLRKPKQIAEVFAAQFRSMMGRTEFSYGHMGHMHHTQVHETPLMIIEQHQTLTGRDSYAARHGFFSQRSAQVITYSKHHGEISRIRIPFSMLKREEIE